MSDSQRLQIQRHLASGKPLTTWQAIEKFKCTTLSQRIREIKAHGFRIASEMVKVGEKRVARYRMVTR